jgi:hypothetical protein
VVLGIFGIAKAFPTNASRAITPPGGAKNPPATPSSPSTSPPKSVPSTNPPTKPLTKNVTVQILNGSGQLGVAASTTDTLKNKNLGFKVQPAGNAPGPHAAVTTIYYKKGFKDSAAYLAQKMFSSAVIKRSTDAAFTADLTVVLGTDFASTATP